MSKPKCEVCGTRHEVFQAHVFAINSAINSRPPAINTPPPAINSAINRSVPKTGDRRSKNGRRVSDYNAYMRLYMAVSRAVKAGRADWWPKRA